MQGLDLQDEVVAVASETARLTTTTVLSKYAGPASR
jgi:hypothetical protein